MKFIRDPGQQKINEYKNLKLEALRKEPSAFSPGLDAYQRYNDAGWREELDRLSTKPYSIIFAEVDVRFVGMCVVRRCEQLKFSHNAFLQGLFVSTGYREQGVGRRLLEDALSILESEGIKNVISEIISSQKASIVLHEKLGFERVGTLKNFVATENEYFDNCYFQKAIQ